MPNFVEITLNHGGDISFWFFKMAAAAILDFWNFKFLTVGTVKREELHQRAKFRHFQDGGRRHLGFWKFQIFNGWDARAGRTASACQILSKSLKPRLRCGHFTIFKMAVAAILDLQNFKFLTFRTVKRFEMHHLAKFRQYRLNRGWDITIFRFFQDGGRPPSWIRIACVGTTHEGHSVEFYHCAKFGWNRCSSF